MERLALSAMLVNTSKETVSWTEEIGPRKNILSLDLKEVWEYRDLLLLLVRRDFVTTYKQTILGPAWFFFQPVLTTIIFVLVFNRIAGISTDGTPVLLFYLAGIILWNYLSECLTRTSTVFRDNSAIFGKVYFPRLIMPLAIVTSTLVKLAIQFALFLMVWAYYLWIGQVQPNGYMFLTPVLIILMAAIGLGFGMIITALTTKYRDLAFLLSFGIQLAMYATPVIYPLSSISSQYRQLIMINPMCSVIEIFRYGFLGNGTFSAGMLSYTAVFAVGILALGSLVFNRVEKTFMDTI